DEGGIGQQIETETSQGSAKATFRLDQAGNIEIRASSEPATVSNIIQLNVTSEGSSVVIITPTPEPTEFPSPTPVTTPEPVIRENPLTNAGYPNLFGWLMIMLILAGGSGLTYWLMGQILEPRWSIRWAMLVLLGGLATYNYLILELPGAAAWLDGRGLAAFLQAVILGQVFGFTLGWAWRSFVLSSRKPQPEK
ncbi:MAG TPA: hypothetical protein DCG54_12655, partial [Anaerolineae bacterium]|nr:hypothetical protein [Anaerolineae bacterium]